MKNGKFKKNEKERVLSNEKDFYPGSLRIHIYDLTSLKKKKNPKDKCLFPLSMKRKWNENAEVAHDNSRKKERVISLSPSKYFSIFSWWRTRDTREITSWISLTRSDVC